MIMVPRDATTLRTRIKSLALDLLIQHGYRGVSFGDITSVLSTTRANIHYHFGSKQKLVEEVLEDYVEDTLADLQEILGQADVPLLQKIENIVEISRRRHLKYNPPGRSGRPWSLIARMRQDSDALTSKGKAALRRFARRLEASITAAIEEAKRRGEFSESMPVTDITLQLVSIANSAGPITQDAGNFDRLEQLYMAFARIIQHAYGTPQQEKNSLRRRGRSKSATAH